MDLEKLEEEYRPYYDEGLKSHWEFSQMFGEEDSDSEFSGSESEEGKLLFHNISNITLGGWFAPSFLPVNFFFTKKKMGLTLGL